MKIGVCAYSFNYISGFEGANPKPLDAFGLMDLAAEFGLQGVEFPPKGCLPNLQLRTLSKAREYAEERGLFIVADGSQVKEENFSEMISAAKSLGSKTLRVILSGILGGDRRPMAGRWKRHLGECLERLKFAREVAESNRVSIAIENHSDATSEDLIRICDQLDSPFIGVNLDSGNPLAVSEEPVSYAGKVAKYLKNVHLKDYNLYPTEEGYRMARCALGKGMVNFPKLFEIFENLSDDLTLTIELGALYARHVRILMDDYWSEFDPRSVIELLPLLRLWLKNVRPEAEEWQTPKEKGESNDVLAKYEMDEFHESVEYLRRLKEQVDNIKLYKACLIGCGRMGATIDDEIRGHPYRTATLPWAHAGGFVASEFTELVAVCDSVAEKSKNIQERYKVPRSYTDYRQMLEAEKPDIISIATRPATHAEIAIYAAEHGVKGIYCEKPLCCSMEEADTILKACDKNGVKFNYGTNRRFAPMFMKIRELIANGEIGEVQCVIAYCGVGVAQWWHTHTADLLLQMANDSEVDFVQGAITGSESKWEGNRLNTDPGIAMGYVQFKNGIRGYLTSATGYECEISGSKGKLRTLNDGAFCQWRKASNRWKNILEEEMFPDVVHNSATVNCINDLVRAIETNSDTMGNIHLACRSQELIFGFIESHRLGGVRMPMPLENRSLYVGKPDW